MSEKNFGKNTIIHGSYIIHVGNYDWGCGVDKAILSLDTELSLPEMGILTGDSYDGLKVRERKMITDESKPDYPLVEAIYERRVTGVYLSDSLGRRTDDASDHLAIELYVSPEEGSPLAFTSKTQIFVWSDPYELEICRDGWEIETICKGKITDADIFHKGNYTASDGTIYRYAEYIPETKTQTLYVWLHGLGEGQKEGNDAYLPIMGRKGTTMAGKAFQETVGGTCVLVPQCPTYWMDADGKESNFYGGTIHADGTSYYTDSLAEFIENYRQKHHLKRVVLAGCSNGGYMCLMLALRHPDRYCAVVPICESVPDDALTEDMIRRLTDVPLYFVYSADDPVVVPEFHEIPTIRRLREAGCLDLHVSVTDQVIDTSGIYRAEDGSPYRYMGHLSWIYYDNNKTDDGTGLSAWEWIAGKIKEDLALTGTGC